MSIVEDLTGQKFGTLTVLKRVEDRILSEDHHQGQWLCKCDCGNEKIVRKNDLMKGTTRSCGCLRGKRKVGDVNA